MKAPTQSVEDAKAATKQFIKGNETMAQSYQSYTTPTSVSQITNTSLEYFGDAAHTVADGTSPEHIDAQGNPLSWNPWDLGAVVAHAAGESTISPEQMGDSVAVEQQLFSDTYGEEAAQQAETSPVSAASPPPTSIDDRRDTDDSQIF